MTNVNAVMGAGLGDEGQSRRVDQLLRDETPAHVVRCNGTGAMVGHGETLVLCHRFMIDPVQPMTDDPIIVSRDCNFITPVDDILGQARMEAHGEVIFSGRGNPLAAALERLKKLPGSSTTAGNFGSFDPGVHERYAKHVLRSLRELFTSGRASSDLADAYESLMTGRLDGMWQSWLASAETFFERVRVVDHDELSRLLRTECLIFTHTQGLLDQEDLPELNCGAGDVIALMNYVGAAARHIRASYCVSEPDEGVYLRVRDDVQRALDNRGNIITPVLIVSGENELELSEQGEATGSVADAAEA